VRRRGRGEEPRARRGHDGAPDDRGGPGRAAAEQLDAVVQPLTALVARVEIARELAERGEWAELLEQLAAIQASAERVAVAVTAGRELLAGRPLRRTTSGSTELAQLLLVLASRDIRTVVQLAAAGDLSPAETLRHLGHLVDRGFIVAARPGAGPAVYRLVPKDARVEGPDPHRRILLVEDDLLVRNLVTLVLEDAGYAVIAAGAPVDATALLEQVAFDLVITDGFSKTDSAVLANTADVVREAGVTPVVLFSAHTIELDVARAAGFRDLITKPFELETLERQVRALLSE
jgi:CheY-like chemotaxis protein